MRSILLLFIPLVEAFTTCLLPNRQSYISRNQQLYATTTEQISKSTPREGVAQQLLNIALKSPLWEYVLVPQARASIVKTAEDNGIPWVDAKEWIKKQRIHLGVMIIKIIIITSMIVLSIQNTTNNHFMHIRRVI